MGQERVYFIFFCGISFLSGLNRIYFVLKKFEIDLIFISALAKASYLWVTNYSTTSHSSHQPSSQLYVHYQQTNNNKLLLLCIYLFHDSALPVNHQLDINIISFLLNYEFLANILVPIRFYTPVYLSSVFVSNYFGPSSVFGDKMRKRWTLFPYIFITGFISYGL